MNLTLRGTLGSSRYNLANKRLRNCETILNKYGFFFPPLYFGTLNVSLEQPFQTPDTGGIFIPQDEIDQVAPGYAEWWKLFPVISINGRKTTGFVYRTRQNSAWDNIAEIVTEDLSSRDTIKLTPRERIEVIINLK